MNLKDNLDICYLIADKLNNFDDIKNFLNTMKIPILKKYWKIKYNEIVKYLKPELESYVIYKLNWYIDFYHNEHKNGDGKISMLFKYPTIGGRFRDLQSQQYFNVIQELEEETEVLDPPEYNEKIYKCNICNKSMYYEEIAGKDVYEEYTEYFCIKHG